jgi:WD40 repeat protein
LVACGERILTLDRGDSRLVGRAMRPRYADRPGKPWKAESLEGIDGPLVLSPSGNRLAVGCGHGDPVTWMPDAPAPGLRVPVSNDGARDLAISPDGRHVASADSYCTLITLLDTTEDWIRRLAGHQDGVTALAFTPDGTRLVSAGEDGFVMAWRTPTASASWTREFRASLLPTAAGEPQAWWAEHADGTVTGSPGHRAWLNPLGKTAERPGGFRASP